MSTSANPILLMIWMDSKRLFGEQLTRKVQSRILRGVFPITRNISGGAIFETGFRPVMGDLKEKRPGVVHQVAGRPRRSERERFTGVLDRQVKHQLLIRNLRGSTVMECTLIRDPILDSVRAGDWR